jgi:DNA-binding PadR family transcriptional regulator
VNLTYPTTLVLQAIANGSSHGFDMIDATGLASGTVYPILRRLEQEGLVSARWEQVSIAREQARPPRRYYELTTAGEDVLEKAQERYRLSQAKAARGRRLRPVRSS